MNQSDRIRYYKAYVAHPLKKEYEEKRKKICKNKPVWYHLINLGYVFFFVMFIAYGWMFFTNKTIKLIDFFSNFLFGFGDLFFLLGIGIANIFLGICYMIYSFDWKEELIENHNKKELNSLDEEYRDKGIFRMTEKELCKSRCGELDINDFWVCSVTGECLSGREVNWCYRPGTCEHCRTFIAAVFGPAEVRCRDHDDYFKR